MNEPATKPRRAQRMGRRASIALARLYNRFYYLWTEPRLPVIRDPRAGGISRRSWSWLFRTVRRRTAPANKHHTLGDASRAWERHQESNRDADLNPATPVIVTSPPNQRKAITPTSKRTAKDVEKPAIARARANVIPLELGRCAVAPVQRRVVVIADCENDTASVEASLRFVGIRGKRGKFKAKARGAHIIQTGDLLHKNRPDPSVVRFWEDLGHTAEAADCALHLVAGNHELEIWRRLQSRTPLGLKRSEQQAVRRLIRRTKLFHVVGSMLFIHGYPTVQLLRHILAYCSDTGKYLNDYNQDRFQAAFDDVKSLVRYAYCRRNAGKNNLLHDVPNPERYYRRHGREVASLLRTLGIDMVIHGHRPERSGVQADFELRGLLPGIRMISHDIQLRLHGLGATVIRQTENAPTDVCFVNRKHSTPAHRAEIRSVLRAYKSVDEHRVDRRNTQLDARASRFARNTDSIVPVFATSRS